MQQKKYISLKSVWIIEIVILWCLIALVIFFHYSDNMLKKEWERIDKYGELSMKIQNYILTKNWQKALEELSILSNYCNTEEKKQVEIRSLLIKTFQDAEQQERKKKWSEALLLYQDIYKQDYGIMKDMVQKKIMEFKKQVDKDSSLIPQEKIQIIENKTDVKILDSPRLKYEEKENGFYRIYAEKHEPKFLYTWKFANGNVYCGNNILYKFSKSGQQKIQLTVFDGETKETREMIISVPEKNVDSNLSDRDEVYEYLQKYQKNIFTSEEKMYQFTNRIKNIILAFGGAYVVIEFENNNILKVYNLIEHSFEKDITLPDAKCILTAGGKFFISYSKSQGKLHIYNFITQEEKIYEYKNIINMVAGLENGTNVFFIEEEVKREGNIDRYGLFNIKNQNVRFLKMNKHEYYFSSDEKKHLYSDAYLHNITYETNGLLRILGDTVDFHTKYGNSSNIFPSSDGNYLFCTQGNIFIHNINYIVKEENMLTVPISNSTLYIGCYQKNDEIYFDIKDRLTFENTQEKENFIRKIRYSRPDKMLASAVADCLIYMESDYIRLFPLKIRH